MLESQRPTGNYMPKILVQVSPHTQQKFKYSLLWKAISFKYFYCHIRGQLDFLLSSLNQVYSKIFVVTLDSWDNHNLLYMMWSDSVYGNNDISTAVQRDIGPRSMSSQLLPVHHDLCQLPGALTAINVRTQNKLNFQETEILSD